MKDHRSCSKVLVVGSLILLLIIVIMDMIKAQAGLNHKIIAGGVVDQIAGIDASMAHFRNSFGGCTNPKTGDVFLLDDARVFMVNRTTNIISIYAGNGLDYLNFGNKEEAIYAGLMPQTCVCEPNGDLYIITSNHIRLVNGSTKIISLFASGIGSPNALAMDDTYLYITESNSATIQKIHKQTKIVTIVAGSGDDYSDNIPATTSTINPTGVAVAPDGSIYLSDFDSKVVRKVDTTTGYISNVVGIKWAYCASGSDICGDGGLATNAKLFGPTSLHFMDNGNLVISDMARIRMVDTKGYISTLAGTGTSNSFLGGPKGDGQSATSVEIRSNAVLFGYNNVVYFTDKGRYRKIENGKVLHAFGGAFPSGDYFGEGGRLINTYIPSAVSSFVFDSNIISLYCQSN